MSKDIEHLEKKIKDNEKKINENKGKIDRNTGALELLHTINGGSKLFFKMWLITFIAYILTVIGFIAYLILK